MPTAIKFRLQEFFDPTDGTYKFRDNDRNAIFTIDPAAGTISFGTAIEFDTAITFSGDATFTGTITKGVAVESFVKELKIPLLHGGTSVGSGAAYFTDSETMQNLNTSEFIIDPDDYPGCTFLLEAICRAGANGDPARTLTIELYDVAGTATVTNSTISTSTTEGGVGPGSLVRLRGATNFRGNLTSGDRTYIARFNTSAAGSFVDIYNLNLVVQF